MKSTSAICPAITENKEDSLVKHVPHIYMRESHNTSISGMAISFHNITRKIKNQNFQKRIGIAEKSQETSRDRCDGNAKCKSLFDSVIHNHFNGIKRICVLYYHPSDLYPFLGFFSDPYSLFEISFFCISILYAFFLIHSWIVFIESSVL